MERLTDHKQPATSAATATAPRFPEEISDDIDAAADATIRAPGDALEVSPDEDPGGDPYNHTGRFQRTSR